MMKHQFIVEVEEGRDMEALSGLARSNGLSDQEMLQKIINTHLSSKSLAKHIQSLSNPAPYTTED